MVHQSHEGEIMNNQEDFRRELASLINKYSCENFCGNTPYFIIADYLYGQMLEMRDLINRRNRWYGEVEKSKILDDHCERISL
jgi:hypothetical protein